MHHPVCGINWFILSASPVTSRLTSSFTYQLMFISIIITNLVIHHSFTLSLQAKTYLFNKSFPSSSISFTYRTAFVTTRLDGPIMLIVLFLVSHFNFLFVPCGRLSWLPVSFLLHVKYTPPTRLCRWHPDLWVLQPAGCWRSSWPSVCLHWWRVRMDDGEQAAA